MGDSKPLQPLLRLTLKSKPLSAVLHDGKTGKAMLPRAGSSLSMLASLQLCVILRVATPFRYSVNFVIETPHTLNFVIEKSF